MPGTVCVGCKIPNGLVLQLFKMEDCDEITSNGVARTVKRAAPEVGPQALRVTLNGPARYVGRDMPHEITHGAGLTFGVDAEFFAEWMKRNKDADFVRNGLVFAQSKETEARAQAKDHTARKSGLEPLDPANLPLEFKGKIETADAKV